LSNEDISHIKVICPLFGKHLTGVPGQKFAGGVQARRFSIYLTGIIWLMAHENEDILNDHEAECPVKVLA